MLQSLSRRMGLGHVAAADPDSLDDEAVLRGLLVRSPIDADTIWAAGPRGVNAPAEFGRVRAEMLPGGVWQIAPHVIFERLARHIGPSASGMVATPRREMAWSNSIRYAGAGAEPLLHIHPDDAEAAGINQGDDAEVASDHGQLIATVAMDPNVRRGVASLTHGRQGAGPGALTSSSTGVDPLTAMPTPPGLA